MVGKKKNKTQSSGLISPGAKAVKGVSQTLVDVFEEVSVWGPISPGLSLK